MHVYKNMNSTQSDFLYSMYLVLREAPLTIHGRYRTFETIAVDIFPGTWRRSHLTLSDTW